VIAASLVGVLVQARTGREAGAGGGDGDDHDEAPAKH